MVGAPLWTYASSVSLCDPPSPLWKETVWVPPPPFTVKVYGDSLTIAPPDAFTVIVYVPGGVFVDVPSVSVLVHVGMHPDGAKDAVAPEGSPEALKETPVDCPARSVAVTDAVVESPAVTVPEDGLKEREKSKDGGVDCEYVTLSFGRAVADSLDR